MMRSLALICLLITAACGVQGDLYLPERETQPARDRDSMPSPYPEQPREDRLDMPQFD